MAAVKWHELPLVAFDTETTGVDPTQARIVTAAVVHMTPGQRPRSLSWVIDPETEVPDEAAAVHGWTNARLEQEIGRPGYAIRSHTDSTGKPARAVITRDAALFEIAAQLGSAMARDAAIVVHNAAYDLTLLEHETRRHDIDPLSVRPAGIRGVVDPMVIEKQFDPWRKVKGGCRGGKVKCGGCATTDKKLESLCAHYGVRHAGAHDAADDAIAAVRLLRKLLDAWPQVASWKLPTLHEHQVTWRREQADSLRAYFDKAGIEHDGVDPGWPVHVGTTAAAGVSRPIRARRRGRGHVPLRARGSGQRRRRTGHRERRPRHLAGVQG